jgi:hypothetical protein
MYTLMEAGYRLGVFIDCLEGVAVKDGGEAGNGTLDLDDNLSVGVDFVGFDSRGDECLSFLEEFGVDDIHGMRRREMKKRAVTEMKIAIRMKKTAASERSGGVIVAGVVLLLFSKLVI